MEQPGHQKIAADAAEPTSDPDAHEVSPEEAILAGPVAEASRDEVPGGPQRRGFLVMFVLAWFGIALATGTISGASIPKFFAFLDDETKGANLSIVAAIGGITVMIITPLFGRLSDRTMSRLGKRRPWILLGALGGFAGAALLAPASALWQVVLGWVIVQTGFGAANAAVHALLADQIPARVRARVAAAASVSAGLALILGAQIIAALPNDQQWTWFILPGGLGALLTIVLYFTLRDILRTEPSPRWQWSDVLSTYWLSPRQHPDFFWAFLCRLFVTMSIVSVALYLLFFIIDHLGVPKEEASTLQANALVMFTIGNILMALLFGWISDRTGRRKGIVLIASLLSATGLLIAILAPNIPVFLLGIIIVGAAQGAYVSVDVALMTEVLPTFKDAGKDLGIVALSYQIPQLAVPIVALPLLAIGGGENYTALYIAAIVFGVIGGLAVIPIKGVR